MSTSALSTAPLLLAATPRPRGIGIGAKTLPTHVTNGVDEITFAKVSPRRGVRAPTCVSGPPRARGRRPRRERNLL
jgi:hypothetical protein